MRTRYFVLVLIALVLGMAGAHFNAKVNALLTTQGYGYGYFSGNYVSPSFIGQQVMLGCNGGASNAISTSTSKATLIAEIESYHSTGEYGCAQSSADITRNKTGASFVIQTMRGVTSTAGSAARPTAAEIADWEDRVNNPAVTITYNSSYPFSINSEFVDYINDDVFYQETGSAPALLFWYGGRVVYVLKVHCANPLGNFPGLPSAAWSLTGNSTANRSSVYPGQTVTFTHTVTKTGTGTPSYVYQVCGSYYSSPTTVPVGCTAWAGPYTTNLTTNRNVTPTVANSGQYFCQRILYSPASSTTTSSGTSTAYCVYVTPVTLTCGAMTVTPSNIDPSTRFNISASVSNSTGSVLAGDAITLTVSKIGGGGYTYGPNTQLVSDTTDPVTVTWSNLGPTGSVGQWAVTWTYTATGGYSKTCGYPLDLNSTFPVAYYPYTTVWGGDVAAGQSPTSATTCYVENDGGAYGWNRLNGANYYGAGSQYAVLALGEIKEFASSLTTATPDKLAFGNVDVAPVDIVHDVASGLYGGRFGDGDTPCDFVSDIGVAATTGNVTIPGRSVSSNNDVVYVKGNVFISGNVAYSSTSWLSISSIPYFKLVVEGDIYIAPGVSQLDGLYIALSDATGASGGHIYTCAPALGTPESPTSGTYYTDCGTRLTINGAFVAKQIQFLRTAGSVGSSLADNQTTSNAAEIFRYSPELWLPRGTSAATGEFKALTGLPPVL